MTTQHKDAPPAGRAAWAYFLDIDGTLIEIADSPDAVYVDKALLRLVARLYRASGGAVALVTGRSIAEIESRLGPLPLPISGQHGLEWRDTGGQVWIRAASPVETRQAIIDALRPVLVRHPGLLLEDKGITLALHYRAAPHLAAYVHRLMEALAASGGVALEVQRGKCVVELKPAGFDKGTAVSAYLAAPPFQSRCPVFIGDDLNDEHAFAEVNRMDGVSIKVGPGPSCARYRLENVSAVRRWLGQALKAPA